MRWLGVFDEAESVEEGERQDGGLKRLIASAFGGLRAGEIVVAN